MSASATGRSTTGGLDQRVEELRRSFDEGLRHAPLEETGRLEPFLLASLCGEAYGFPLSHALEVVPAPRIVPVPGVPGFVLGIVNFRGQVLSVCSIHGPLGLAVGDAAATGKVIVTRGLGLTTGLLVDGVERIIEIETAAVQPIPSTTPNDRAGFLAGQVRENGELISLLDAKGLATALGIEQRGGAADDPHHNTDSKTP